MKNSIHPRKRKTDETHKQQREAERDEELERERLSSLTTIDAALEGWRRALRIARETEAA